MTEGSGKQGILALEQKGGQTTLDLICVSRFHHMPELPTSQFNG